MGPSVFLFFAAYLVGSVNVAILLFKVLKKEDPRKSHSGNPGTTNVYRQAGFFWALVVLVLDFGKAVLVGLGALYYVQSFFIPWIALGLLLGNRFPCFHRFKGGKGVANYLGFVAAINPLAAGLSMLLWGGLLGLLRKPFVSSFGMAAILTFGMIQVAGGEFISLLGGFISFLFIVWSHRENIEEFLSGKKGKKDRP